jgi:hypothetical protein
MVYFGASGKDKMDLSHIEPIYSKTFVQDVAEDRVFFFAGGRVIKHFHDGITFGDRQ